MSNVTMPSRRRSGNSRSPGRIAVTPRYQRSACSSNSTAQMTSLGRRRLSRHEPRQRSRPRRNPYPRLGWQAWRRRLRDGVVARSRPNVPRLGRTDSTLRALSERAPCLADRKRSRSGTSRGAGSGRLQPRPCRRRALVVTDSRKSPAPTAVPALSQAAGTSATASSMPVSASTRGSVWVIVDG